MRKLEFMNQMGLQGHRKTIWFMISGSGSNVRHMQLTVVVRGIPLPCTSMERVWTPFDHEPCTSGSAEALLVRNRTKYWQRGIL
jgi:hypothetical protein